MLNRILGSKINTNGADVAIKLERNGFYLRSDTLNYGTELLVSWKTAKDGELTTRTLNFHPNGSQGMFVRTDGKPVDVSVVQRDDVTPETTAEKLRSRSSRATNFRVTPSDSSNDDWWYNPLNPTNPWGIFQQNFGLTPQWESGLPPAPREEELPPASIPTQDSPPSPVEATPRDPFSTDVPVADAVGGGVTTFREELDSEIGGAVSSYGEAPTEGREESPFDAIGSDSEATVDSSSDVPASTDSEPSAY